MSVPGDNPSGQAPQGRLAEGEKARVRARASLFLGIAGVAVPFVVVALLFVAQFESLVPLFLGGLASILALLLGYASRREIRRSNQSQGGLRLAAAGIALGWIGIALALLLPVAAFYIVMSAFQNG